MTVATAANKKTTCKKHKHNPASQVTKTVKLIDSFKLDSPDLGSSPETGTYCKLSDAWSFARFDAREPLTPGDADIEPEDARGGVAWADSRRGPPGNEVRWPPGVEVRWPLLKEAGWCGDVVAVGEVGMERRVLPAPGLRTLGGASTTDSDDIWTYFSTLKPFPQEWTMDEETVKQQSTLQFAEHNSQRAWCDICCIEDETTSPSGEMNVNDYIQPAPKPYHHWFPYSRLDFASDGKPHQEQLPRPRQRKMKK